MVVLEKTTLTYHFCWIKDVTNSNFSRNNFKQHWGEEVEGKRDKEKLYVLQMEQQL